MDVAPEGLAAHPKRAADGQHVHPLFVQLPHLLVVGHALAARGFSGGPLLRRTRLGGVFVSRGLVLGGRRYPNRGEHPVIVLQDSLGGFPQVLQQMPAVENLHGFRSAFFDAPLVLGGAVAADDLEGRILLEPGGQCFCGAIRQELYGAVAVEVHDDRPVAPATPQSEVIDANHLGRRMGGGCRTSDVAQQGRGTRRHTQALDQSGSGLPAQCEAHQFQDLVQAGRLTSVGFDEVGQALGEDPARASRLWTAELPNVQEQPHAATTPRQVGYSTPVMTMQPRRFPTTSWTGHR